MGKPLRTPCPPWCADHDGGKAPVHRSAHSRIPLSGPGAHTGMAYAFQSGNGPVYVFLNTSNASMQVGHPFEAKELAQLIELLGPATDAQCRKLAAQVRAAAHVAFGTGKEEVLGGWL